MKFIVDVTVGMPAVGKQYGHLADGLLEALCQADLELDWVGSIDSVGTPSERVLEELREAKPSTLNGGRWLYHWVVTTDAVPVWLQPSDVILEQMRQEEGHGL